MFVPFLGLVVTILGNVPPDELQLLQEITISKNTHVNWITLLTDLFSYCYLNWDVINYHDYFSNARPVVMPLLSWLG